MEIDFSLSLKIKHNNKKKRKKRKKSRQPLLKLLIQVISSIFIK